MFKPSYQNLRPFVACLAVFRCAALVAVLIVGAMVAMSMQAQPYYVLAGDEGLVPHCRAVIIDSEKIFDTSTNLVKADLGQRGRLVDMPDAAAVLTIERLVKASGDSGLQTETHTEIDTALDDASRLHVDGCALTIPSLGMKEDLRMVALMDARDAQEISMLSRCGGEKPGWWLQGAPGGVWVSPLVGSLMAWFVVRSGLLILASKFTWILADPYAHCDHGGKNKKIAGCWIATVCMMTFVACSVLISPLQRLTGVDDCSKLVTSFYSGKAQVCITVLSFFFVIAVAFALARAKGELSWMSSFDSKNDIEHAKEEIMKSAFSLSCVKDVYTEWESDEKLGNAKRVARACGPLTIWALTIFCLLLRCVEIANTSFSLAFGLDLNLDIFWPAIELNARIHLMKVVLFMLWMFDTMSTALDVALAVRPEYKPGANVPEPTSVVATEVGNAA